MTIVDECAFLPAAGDTAAVPRRPSGAPPGGPSAGRRRARARARRHALVVVVVVAGLAGGAAGVQAHVRTRLALEAEQSQLAAAQRGLGVLEQRALDQQAALARNDDLLAAVGDDQDVAVAEATALAEQAAAAMADAALLDAGLGAAGSEVSATTDRLAAVRGLLALQGTQIDDLRACTGGVASATSTLRAGGPAAAVGALQGVTDACRRAQLATGTAPASARFPFDFPDPFVVAGGDGYYAYATNATGGAVQLVHSLDLVTWTFIGDALAGVPGWARSDATWAPAVVERGGRWLLYYTARELASGDQCISVAVAASLAGPFTDTSAGPLVCDRGEGGSIDPSPFVAPDGTLHLLWKSEGETIGRSPQLRSQRLTDDGLALQGPPSVLLSTDQPWEDRTIEGPSMIATGAGYLLLYSANRWDGAGYAVGAAWCAGPAGPCTKVPGPVLASRGTEVGPGGAAAFVAADGSTQVAYHAWAGANVGYPHARFLHIAPLAVLDGRPVIG